RISVPTMTQSVEGVSYLAAFGGGVASFAPPCALPIVPAYLSAITGLAVAEVRSGPPHHLGRIARDTTLFVAGFSAVFILLGLSATAVGQALFRNHLLLTRLSGVAVLTMALLLIGSLALGSGAGLPGRLRAPWMYAEARFHPSPSRFGPFAAPIAGAAFGFGWTPCLGPVLGAILNLALLEGSPGRAAFLMAFYSLGLGVPFLAAGLAFGRLSRLFTWVKQHFQGITVASASVLGAFGVILILNR